MKTATRREIIRYLHTMLQESSNKFLAWVFNSISDSIVKYNEETELFEVVDDPNGIFLRDPEESQSKEEIA